MMAFSIINLSHRVKIKVKKLLDTTANFGQVTVVIFEFLRLSATITLLTLGRSL